MSTLTRQEVQSLVHKAWEGVVVPAGLSDRLQGFGLHDCDEVRSAIYTGWIGGVEKGRRLAAGFEFSGDDYLMDGTNPVQRERLFQYVQGCLTRLCNNIQRRLDDNEKEGT